MQPRHGQRQGVTDVEPEARRQLLAHEGAIGAEVARAYHEERESGRVVGRHGEEARGERRAADRRRRGRGDIDRRRREGEDRRDPRLRAELRGERGEVGGRVGGARLEVERHRGDGALGQVAGRAVDEEEGGADERHRQGEAEDIGGVARTGTDEGAQGAGRLHLIFDPMSAEAPETRWCDTNSGDAAAHHAPNAGDAALRHGSRPTPPPYISSPRTPPMRRSRATM